LQDLKDILYHSVTKPVPARTADPLRRKSVVLKLGEETGGYREAAAQMK